MHKRLGGGVTSMTQDHPYDRPISMPEAAIRLGVSVATVRRLIETDGLPARRIGRQIRIPRTDFENWLLSRDVPASAGDELG